MQIYVFRNLWLRISNVLCIIFHVSCFLLGISYHPQPHIENINGQILRDGHA